MSFLKYKYTVIKSFIIEPYRKLASVEDIAWMKLSAIISSSTQKYYVDLYYILQNHKLDRLLGMAKKKFPEIDINLIIKSLVYFDDIVEEPIIFKNDNHISLNEIKASLSRRVQEYFI